MNEQEREFSRLRGLWRAALALALHTGFLALPGAVSVGLLGVAAYTYRYDTDSGLRAGLAAVLVTTVVVLLVRAVLRTRTQPQGAAVDKSSQTQLWRAVDDIATAADAPVPDRIRITSEPVVRMRAETTLLGLRLQRRHLEIGLPLLAGLTVSELRTTVAREIGLLSAGGRVVGLVHRTAVSVAETSSELTGGPTKWLFAGYARLYAAVTAPVTRQLQLDADAVAARVEGKRVALATLRKSFGIELGWRDYSGEYLSMAVSVERTPDLLLGFRAFLDHPERKKQLSERAKQAISEESEQTAASGTAVGVDGNTTARRLEALKQLSAGDEELDDRPALALIRNARRNVPALEDQLVVDGMGPRVPWPELVRMAGAQESARQAAVLSSAVLQSGVSSDPRLGGVLAAIHQGQAADLVNPVLNPGLDPESVDEAALDTMTDLLGAAVVDALVRAGHAHHELDWGGPPKVRLTSGQLLDPDRLVRPAVTDPGLIPGLHRHLVHLGVPLDHAQPAAEDPEPVLSGIVSPVQCSGGLHELLVTDRGLLLLTSRTGTAQRILAGALTRVRRSENEQLAELADTPVAELRQSADAQWVDSRDVATARLRQDRSGWALTLELYLDEYAVSDLDPAGTSRGAENEDLAAVELRGTADSVEWGAPYSGLGEVMGARMSVDDALDRDE